MARPDLCISSDSHVVETPDIFDGLDLRFGDLAPRIVFEEGKGDILHVNGRAGLNIGRFGIAGHFANDPETQQMMREGFRGLRKGIVDPMERIKDQKIDGLDAEVLLPSVMFGIYPVDNSEIVAATFKNYNDWILNYTSQAKDRLFPTACISLLDIDEAIEELHRVKRMGHVGANIPCIPPVDRPYSDQEFYEPFWKVAEELEMPMVMHVNCSAQPNHGLPNWGPVMSYCMWPAGMAKVIGDLIWSGVCARYPKLKFVCTEFETGWIAQFLQRLDWSIHRVPSHIIPAEVTEPGSYYWKQNFLATFEDDRVGLLTREEIGVNTLMWGSDFPHHDSTFPRSQDVLDDIFDGIPDEDRFRITVANCVELYKLPIEY